MFRYALCTEQTDRNGGDSMKTAKRLEGMRESFIREMTRLALTHNAINLSQGFPDYDAPPEVIEAAKEALGSGLNQYGITWGIPALRQAIAETMATRYGLSFDPDRHITVTCGVTEAMAVIFMSPQHSAQSHGKGLHPRGAGGHRRALPGVRSGCDHRRDLRPHHL
jgi:DNA-binding transcriptional MocR family regulator